METPQRVPEETARLVRDIDPIFVVDTGYNLFLRSYLDPDAPEMASAIRVVRRFDALDDAVPDLSHEAMFMLAIRAAINSLVKGLRTRRENREKMEGFAYASKTKSDINILRGGLWKFGLWLAFQMVFGVFVFCFGISLGETFLPGISQRNVDPDKAVWSMAFVTTLVAFSMKSVWSYVRGCIVEWRFHYNLHKAAVVYGMASAVEYDRLATSACKAYATLHGRTFKSVMEEYWDDITLRILTLTGGKPGRMRNTNGLVAMAYALARLAGSLKRRPRKKSKA